MNVPVCSITRARVQSDLAALNALGRDPDTGILLRPAGSVAENAALEWFRRRVDAARIDYVVDEHGFAAPGRDGAAVPVVIAGELVAAAGAGPFDGALGIVAGLEVLRCLPASVNGIALAAGSSPGARAASCLFRCVAAGGSMLSDSGRPIGVALSATAPLSMQRVCEIGAAAGIGVLPMPFAATGTSAGNEPLCVLVVDGALNRWPPDEAGWAVAATCADLLLNLVVNLAGY